MSRPLYWEHLCLQETMDLQLPQIVGHLQGSHPSQHPQGSAQALGSVGAEPQTRPGDTTCAQRAGEGPGPQWRCSKSCVQF